MSITYGRFRVDEQENLIQVINDVCGESPYMATAYFQPTPAWRHALTATECVCHVLLLARDEGRIVGWCRLFPEGPGNDPKAELGIGLLSTHRLQGLGTMLMAEALEQARQASSGRVSLQVHPTNRVARHLFEKCGFQYDVMANGLLTMTQRLFAKEQHE